MVITWLPRGECRGYVSVPEWVKVAIRFFTFADIIRAASAAAYAILMNCR